MALKNYDKPPISFEQQLTLMQTRGLQVNNEERARRYLSQISYYRLSAYFLPYQKEKDKFNCGVTFDNILDTYTFDRELRLLVFDCIERIEIAIRTQMVYVLSHKYNNSHWQDDKSIFKQGFINKYDQEINPYKDFQRIIKKSLNAKHPEVFVKHYKETYKKPVNPPAWACVELLTIGELSRIFNGLKNNSDKKQIAEFFGVSHKVFRTWLHSLTYVRNICAHHSRLWNKELSIRPDLIKSPRFDWMDTSIDNNKRTFYFLCVLKYLMKSANTKNTFTKKLRALIDKYPTVPIGHMGIPTVDGEKFIDWENEPVWKN